MSEQQDSLSLRRTQLSNTKQAILDKWRKGRLPGASPAIFVEHISRRKVQTSAPLSFAQQRIWFLHQMEPEGTFYTICDGVRLLGNIHVTALQQSLGEIMARHDVLRARFTTSNGELVQVIQPAEGSNAPMRFIDLRDLPQLERASQALHIAQNEARLPFDLAHGPLIRTTLLRLAENEYIFLLSLHHIIFDGWSAGVFYRELMALYAAFSEGLPSPLPALPIQYPDFAAWQRQWFQGEILEQQLRYWKQQLQGLPALLHLPSDRPREGVRTFHGSWYEHSFNTEVTTALKALSQQNQATLYMTLLAAFTTLLSYYGKQEDILIGSPIANRTRVELSGLIGFFINTLAMRIDLSGDPSFLHLLARVREVASGAYAHQDLPFEKLVEELPRERGKSRNPLFQIMFVLQDDSHPNFELPGITLQPLAMESRMARFELTFFLVETKQGLHVTVEYDTDLFDAATIIFYTRGYEILLQHIVEQPESKLHELHHLLLAEDTRRKMTESQKLDDRGLAKLKQARRKPLSQIGKHDE